ncbi:2-oxoglutarate (2OG) and Fe(II)-dependent oxygenase superfamily protein [Hibiscus syriacus]|uniref:2-oxoglutarate (2OG) and Fe(II)-dependent oxygenase superfamily protein n=1 Tax=Hibiscus syriacus TaxID=106335 RepID=A0A6A3C9H4_HIBSY|nr:uncharacterized protein LOC120204938 [Hibiscus syriacus]KAE8723729.1 2-oxoglutarate (2OG) and Fe(II)-dependent oxygenase superfamily protein [Hibiscus syriacus]
MGRAAFTKAMVLMLREAKRSERPLSKIAGADREIINKCNSKDGVKGSSTWVPHPKSGIYFPKGQEWVMEMFRNGRLLLAEVFGSEAQTVSINRRLVNYHFTKITISMQICNDQISQ